MALRGGPSGQVAPWSSLNQLNVSLATERTRVEWLSSLDYQFTWVTRHQTCWPASLLGDRRWLLFVTGDTIEFPFTVQTKSSNFFNNHVKLRKTEVMAIRWCWLDRQVDVESGGHGWSWVFCHGWQNTFLFFREGCLWLNERWRHPWRCFWRRSRSTAFSREPCRRWGKIHFIRHMAWGYVSTGHKPTRAGMHVWGGVRCHVWSHVSICSLVRWHFRSVGVDDASRLDNNYDSRYLAPANWLV